MNKTRTILINHLEKFIIFSNEEFIKNQIYSPITIAEEVKQFFF